MPHPVSHQIDYLHTDFVFSKLGTKEVTFPVRVTYRLQWNGPPPAQPQIEIEGIVATLCGWPVELQRDGIVFNVVKADAIGIHRQRLLDHANRKPETQQ